MQVFDTLVVFDNNKEIVGSLAEKYEITPDGIEYTFSLQKGVKFTDGIEFKVSDAKFSIEQRA